MPSGILAVTQNIEHALASLRTRTGILERDVDASGGGVRLRTGHGPGDGAAIRHGATGLVRAAEARVDTPSSRSGRE